jgi:3',5'-cyclic AMP phosphodiesterase CpdA
VVIGDFGTGEADEYEVAAAIREWVGAHPVDALVTTGDNIYETGHPDRFQASWHRPYGWLDAQGIEVLAALGNHDARTAGGLPVMRLLGMPGPWYVVSAGDVEFVILDGSHPDDSNQRSFLETTLRRSEAAWQVVVVHQPPFSCGQEHGSSREVRDLVLGARGADLVLSGHDHTYQRFPPVRGATFVVSGGGGAPLDPLGECPEGTPRPASAFADVHHFLYVRSTGDGLVIRAIRVPGSTPGDRFRVPGQGS